MGLAHNALQYLGVLAKAPPTLQPAERAPSSSTDRKYRPGTLWMDSLNLASYQWSGNVWIALGTGASGGVVSITGDTGTAASGAITLLGTAAQGLSFSSSASNVTGTIADWTTAQKGVGVLSTNAQSVTGTGTTQAVTPASLTARLQAPGAIGGTTPGSGAFTTLSSTGLITAGTGLTATTGALTATNGNLVFGTAGNKISAPAATTITAGANSFGRVALVGGAAIVATTAVSATSIILITNQVLGTVAAPFPLAVTARTAATSFTITSADATDTSTIGWMIIN